MTVYLAFSEDLITVHKYIRSIQNRTLNDLSKQKLYFDKFVFFKAKTMLAIQKKIYFTEKAAWKSRSNGA